MGQICKSCAELYILNTAITVVPSEEMLAAGIQSFADCKLPDLADIQSFAYCKLPDLAFSIQRVVNLQTWHNRLGHANHRYIEKMARKGMVNGMQIDLSASPPSCESCIQGKQTRSSVPKEREGVKAEGALNTVYVDLIGPQHVPSVNGNLYVMNIIDNHSSYSWSIPLKTKDATLPTLVKWMKEVKLERDRRVCLMRVDNGELRSNVFDAYATHIGFASNGPHHTHRHITVDVSA